ncbi:mycothiol synthase [Nocardiopsis suaedae]|uniref:Mycothiol acetyltransferase n=1 Tax=Nocardiopsis suaedae TaxID=3018444 RepID=A0ABT4TLP7_9ACTN|nr:mycothiol synthase [Nocardiopsis suaedae]MDA2805619.1 mycothiol synthase [Nocardiopsis suaedae]
MDEVRIVRSLDEEDAERVLALAEEAHALDGAEALSEQTVLRVRHGSPEGTARFHLLDEEGDLAGFAFAEKSADEPDSAELLVAPGRRRRGHGTALARSLRADAGAAGVRVWAHGRLPAAQGLAEALGWHRARGLLKMRLRLRGGDGAPVGLPEPKPSGAVADGVRVRAFRPGEDEAALVRSHAAAFADHPEQGGVTLEDLRQRQAEPWFDAEGFFVAEETGGPAARGAQEAQDAGEGRIAGFHWTKVHADGAGLTDGEPVGEVYVVGVAPSWQGTGLGRLLTLAGVRYLRDRGLPWVLLYVDEDNRAAVRLYETLGFEVWDGDVMYAPGD